MSIIYFILILAALILVHELGHFLVAKAAKMRVDEFGLGFPPRLARLWKKDETEYTLNLLPIGGFVKIFGENYDDVNQSPEPERDRGFINKPRYQQALVLVAGVTFNMVLAWLLIAVGYMVGLPTPVDHPGGEEVKDPRVVVVGVQENSPAAEAGIQTGDTITAIAAEATERQTELQTASADERVAEFIGAHADQELTLEIARGEEEIVTNLTPAVLEGGDKKMAGIQMNVIGTLQLAPHKALGESLITTGKVTVAVVIGLGQFVYEALVGVADYGQIGGPVRIVDMVGDASTLGFIYLLQFAAFISINLAVINLLPVPALDGGRLLFVAIEALKGSPIKPHIAHALNTAGFVLLIILMIAVTFNDIVQLS